MTRYGTSDWDLISQYIPNKTPALCMSRWIWMNNSEVSQKQHNNRMHTLGTGNEMVNYAPLMYPPPQTLGYGMPGSGQGSFDYYRHASSYGYGNAPFFPGYSYPKMPTQYNRPPPNNGYYGTNMANGFSTNSSYMKQGQQFYQTPFGVPSGMFDMQYGSYGMPMHPMMHDPSMGYPKSAYPYNDSSSSYNGAPTMPRLTSTSYPQIPASLSE